MPDVHFLGADTGRRMHPARVLARHSRPRDVVRRSLRVAAAVGTLLVLINYGDRLLAGDLRRLDWFKMALTYLVPCGVSTYASVGALRSRTDPVRTRDPGGCGPEESR